MTDLMWNEGGAGSWPEFAIQRGTGMGANEEEICEQGIEATPLPGGQAGERENHGRVEVWQWGKAWLVRRKWENGNEQAEGSLRGDRGADGQTQQRTSLGGFGAMRVDLVGEEN